MQENILNETVTDHHRSDLCLSHFIQPSVLWMWDYFMQVITRESIFWSAVDEVCLTACEEVRGQVIGWPPLSLSVAL